MGKNDVGSTVHLVINGKQAVTELTKINEAVAALTVSFNTLKAADNLEAYRKKELALLRLKQTYREMRSELEATTKASHQFIDILQPMAMAAAGSQFFQFLFKRMQAMLANSLPIGGKQKERKVAAKTVETRLARAKRTEQHPSAPQFYGGGLTDVYGASDGKKYAAKNIGSIAAGGLIDQTSLGLFGERGAMIDGIISNIVTTDNYIIFSTTKISWEGESKVIGVGAFGNVFLTKKLDEALNEGLLSE